jgi:hypothetical protein
VVQTTYITHLVERLHRLLVLGLVVLELLAGCVAFVVHVLVVGQGGGELLLQCDNLTLQRAVGRAGIIARTLSLSDSLLEAKGLGAELRGGDVVTVDLFLQSGDLALSIGDLAALDVDVVLEVVAFGVGVAELVDLVVEFWEACVSS